MRGQGEGESSDFKRVHVRQKVERDVDKDYDNNKKSITWKRRRGNA